MKFEIDLKSVIFVVLLICGLAFCLAATWLELQSQKTEIAKVREELKYSQNFTTIVNQLNQNTADIKAIAQVIQAAQKGELKK